MRNRKKWKKQREKCQDAQNNKKIKLLLDNIKNAWYKMYQRKTSTAMKEIAIGVFFMS